MKLPTKNQSRTFQIPLVALVALVPLVALLFAPFPLLADGLFVSKWKWNKEVDINEPTQKAIILYDAGREDMLLQVKYEGRVSEFGWLIPVPSLPKIEKGSMQAFYELSQLTQERFGNSKGPRTGGMFDSVSQGSSVQVIQIKTVGAYEVAVLSAGDTGSLGRWLRSHGYSIPEGKSEIVEDYVRKGWYFIAAKIDLNGRGAVKMASSGAPKDPDADVRSAKTIGKKLASGELHPLLISFNTPQCVFPLKISAAAGQASELSLYVLSDELLLNKSLFDEAMEKLEHRRAEWIRDEPRRRAEHQNMRATSLAYQMYVADLRNGGARLRARPSDPPPAALLALVREQVPLMADESLEDRFYASPEEILHCMRLSSQQIRQTAKSLPRLKAREWYLTKVVRIFAPAEMHDLVFEPALPVLTAALEHACGRTAAEAISRLGPAGISVLVTRCRAADSVTRANAASGLTFSQNCNLAVPLLDLFHDDAPQVRLHAVCAADGNWDDRFAEPLRLLFRDSYKEIRGRAMICLSRHERRSSKEVYLALLKDSDANVKSCSLMVLFQLDRNAIPSEPLVEMLRDPQPEVQAAALHMLWQLNRDVAPRADLLPLLCSSDSLTVNTAWKLIEGTGRVQPALPEPLASEREEQLKTRALTSAEAAVLTTNHLITARLIGLRVFQRNADSKAIELTLPLLRDPNEIVRSRAFGTMAAITGKEISKDDAAKWEQWWMENKDTFTAR